MRAAFIWQVRYFSTYRWTILSDAGFYVPTYLLDIGHLGLCSPSLNRAGFGVDVTLNSRALSGNSKPPLGWFA